MHHDWNFCQILFNLIKVSLYRLSVSNAFLRAPWVSSTAISCRVVHNITVIPLLIYDNYISLSCLSSVPKFFLTQLLPITAALWCLIATSILSFKPLMPVLSEADTVHKSEGKCTSADKISFTDLDQICSVCLRQHRVDMQSTSLYLHQPTSTGQA